MTKTIVTTSLLTVRQDAVSLGRFFELLFRACIVRVLVRVKRTANRRKRF